MPVDELGGSRQTYEVNSSYCHVMSTEEKNLAFNAKKASRNFTFLDVSEDDMSFLTKFSKKWQKSFQSKGDAKNYPPIFKNAQGSGDKKLESSKPIRYFTCNGRWHISKKCPSDLSHNGAKNTYQATSSDDASDSDDDSQE